MKKKQPIQVTLPRVAPAKKPARKAKPAKKPAACPIPPPMIRLRLPSEKPTRDDADEDGNVFTIFTCESGGKDSIKWPWNKPFDGDEIAWFSLPEGILPREPSQEEKWRAEFEEKFNSKYPDGSYKEAAWQGFLAAKEGGAE